MDNSAEAPQVLAKRTPTWAIRILFAKHGLKTMSMVILCQIEAIRLTSTQSTDNRKEMGRDSYVSAADIEAATSIPETDQRTLRRHTGGPRQARRGKVLYELEGTIAWLSRILPRLDPSVERDLRTAAKIQDEKR